MSESSLWINWFRDVAPKLPGAAPALGASVVDPERLRRVLHGKNVSAAVQNLSHIKSLSPAERMINWLKTQPADVVDAAVQYLNWDRAEEVVLWLLGQPTTDAATAVKLFMRAVPQHYVRKKADNPTWVAGKFEEKAIRTFAANWIANRYSRGGVAYDPSEVTPYGSSDIFHINDLNELMARASFEGVNPLPTLAGLAGPFKGQRPKDLDVYLKPKGRGELFLVRFLLAGLGTWMMDDEISEADFDEWILKNDLRNA